MIAVLGESWFFFFFLQAEDGIRDYKVTGVQTCALPISRGNIVASDSNRRAVATRSRCRNRIRRAAAQTWLAALLDGPYAPAGSLLLDDRGRENSSRPEVFEGGAPTFS